jgi:hypothetical protein
MMEDCRGIRAVLPLVYGSVLSGLESTFWYRLGFGRCLGDLWRTFSAVSYITTFNSFNTWIAGFETSLSGIVESLGG